MTEIAATNLRCPHCRSRSLFAVETIEGNTQFDIVDGKFARDAGTHEFGAYTRLDARCAQCDHRWKVRNAIQITDIIDDAVSSGQHPTDSHGI